MFQFQIQPSAQRFRQCCRANIRWKTRVRPTVAPVAELQSRLRKAVNHNSLLQIYLEEKVNFTSVHWSTVTKRLFKSKKKSSKSLGLKNNPPSPSRDLMDPFLDDLADFMEGRGIGLFGVNQTATIVRSLISNSALDGSPAVARIVSIASQWFEAFVEQGDPMDVAVLLSAMAKVNLRESFHAAIDYLEADRPRVRWVLSGRSIAPIFLSLSEMECKAQKLIDLIVSDPGRAIGPHVPVASIAEFLSGYVALGCRGKKISEVLVDNHHWIVNQGSANVLADIAHSIATANMVDCKLFFEAVENRASWFGQQGAVVDFAKMTWAASVMFASHELPQLFQSIDSQGMDILVTCIDESIDRQSEDLPVATDRLDDLATIVKSFACLEHQCPSIHAALGVYAHRMHGETLVIDSIERSLRALGHSIPQFPKKAVRL